MAAKPPTAARARKRKVTPRRADAAPARAVRPVPSSASPAARARAIAATLAKQGSVQAARFASRFFKTGAGEYGEGDRFLGVNMPAVRRLARDIGEAGIEVALPLLKSGWHEARTLALVLLVNAFQKGDPRVRKAIYRLYLRHARHIDNWDLVDISAPHIVGGWLADKPTERRRVLTRLAKSSSLWERRIAILATLHNIRQGDATETLRLARLLLHDKEDLIQKAVGWMLREVGKRVGQETEEAFLQQVYRQMPRTMLRYAIERFPEPLRKRYLLGVA